MKGAGGEMHFPVSTVVLLWGILHVSCQLSASPEISEVSATATFSWQIPENVLQGRFFFAVSPIRADTAVWRLTSTGDFRAYGNYSGRVVFSGDYTSRDITFTMSDIRTSDAGDYKCGVGGATTIIPDCGQRLVVLVRCQLSASPEISEVSATATFSWQIPQGGLTPGFVFFAVSPDGQGSVFRVTSTGDFRAYGNYTGRVTFTGNYTTRDITFTLSNIQTSDAGEYTCGNGGAGNIVDNCGQRLIVLGKPTTPVAPVPNTTPVYNQPVTLTCISTSTTVPADHGLTLTYIWQRSGSEVSGQNGSSYSFTVGSRDSEEFRCRGRESQGLESDWSPVYTMQPQYAPYQISLNPATPSYPVREGQDTISSITCSANCSPTCSYSWLENGTNYISGATLSLGQAARSLTGSYVCQSNNSYGSSNSQTVSVDVQYPAEVSITPPSTCSPSDPYIVYEGQQNVQLTCHVTAANPSVTSYMWKKDGRVISETSRVLSISSVRRSHEGSYTCQGINGLSSPTDSQALNVHVQYSPSVTVKSSRKVVEGQNLTVTCSVDARPDATVRWTRKDGGSFTPQTGPTLSLPNIQRSQSATYVCTATNTLTPCGQQTLVRSDSGEVHVDVQFKSIITSFTVNAQQTGSVTVDEGDSVTLTCHVESNPRSTIRLLNGSVELTSTETNDTSISKSFEVDCRQRGDYSCAASNNIGSAVNQVINLLVQCSPHIDDIPQNKYASKIGGDVTISVPVLAFPLPTLTWSSNSSTSQDLTGVSIPVSDISVSAVLSLVNLQQQDFGEYKLTVDNNVGGEVIFSVTVDPEGPPEIPTNVTVTSNSHDSLLVSWKQEFNGGAEQKFIVEYSKDNITWIHGREIDESDPVFSYLQTTIGNLDSSTIFSVRVVAKNKYGTKGYSEIVTGLTQDLPTVAEESNTGTVVGVILGCVAVIAGAVVVMVIVLKRREILCFKSKKSSEESHYSDLDRDGQERDTYTGLQPYVNAAHLREERDGEDSSRSHYSDLTDQNPQTNTELRTYANVNPLPQESPYENVSHNK